MEFKIVILNDHPSNTSIGILLESITESIGENYEVITLLNRQLDNETYPGRIITGLNLSKISSFSNYSLRNIIHHRLLKKFKEDKALIFYINQSVAPLNYNIQGALIQDSIQAITKSNLYTDKYLYKWSTNLNLKKFCKFPLLLANSNYVKDSIYKYGYEGEVDVLHHCVPKHIKKIEGLDKNRVKERLGLPLDRKLLLNISTKVYRKNLGMVRQIMSKLDDFSLVRVGDQLEVKNSINFKNVSHSVINELYNISDAFLFPSYEEGYGLPLIEAMSVGLPIVASDIPIVREIAKDASCLANPNDLDGFIDCVIKTIDDREYYAKKGIELTKKFTFEEFRDGFRKHLVHIYKNYA